MSFSLTQDGVHLSSLGNRIFLNTLQGGLEYFASGKGPVFPDSYQFLNLCNYIVYPYVHIVLDVGQFIVTFASLWGWLHALSIRSYI